jgi:hypothetical protein
MIGEAGHGARLMPAKSLRSFLILDIDHEIPFAYERQLCARSGRSRTDKLLGICLSVDGLTPFV